MIKNATVSFYCGHWYVSFQTEFEQQILEHTGGEIEIDLGIAFFAPCSNQKMIKSPRPLKRYEKKTSERTKISYQKTKAFESLGKTKLKVQKKHKKIADIQKDFMHKTSTNLCKNNALIVLEDLKPSNMSKTAKGDKQNPVQNVKAKSRLNKAILFLFKG